MAQVEGAIIPSRPEGKVLLMADTRGMFRVDTALLNQVNSIGDLTISTLPDHFQVEAGDRLASMRIVPLVTQEAQILEAERLCQGRKLLDLRPYHARKAGVIITGSEIYTAGSKISLEPVVRAKLAHYPGEILGVTICDDDLNMSSTPQRAIWAQCAAFPDLHGRWSVDPDDLTPTAIRRLGAEIITHGVPAQPAT